MAVFRTALQTIAEMREFAGFTAEEQAFLERSLALGRCGPSGGEAQPWSPASQAQAARYGELRGLRGAFGADQPLAAIDGFFAALVRISAQDLSRGMLASFGAYRFLYERLLGAAVRPYLPASFCAAAALPQVAPVRRTLLLATVSEAVAATPGWSEREPVFVPCRVSCWPDCDQ